MKSSELKTLERELAYDTARADIESICNCVHHSGKYYGEWHDLASVPSDPSLPDGTFVAKAVRYLELRKLLKRHPENRDLVRIIDTANADISDLCPQDKP